MFYDITEVFYYQGQFIHCLKKKNKRKEVHYYLQFFFN